MDSELERQALAIFEGLFDMPESERDATITRSCAGNAALEARVRLLLHAHLHRGSFLKSVDATDGSTPTALNAPGVAAESHANDFPPGTLIGRYKLLQLLGEGGFGSVFMADQREPVARKIALKIVKWGMDTRQVVARFEQERQALAIMDHPNIAKVLDAGATPEGRPYFVMELVNGIPITKFCDRERLSIPDRLALFEQVCQAVQHAHQKGIIHRDLKPSNVLVSMQDGRPFAKVIDFGIAKATQARLTEKTLFTEHRAMIGTPEYMSPEQAEGSVDIDTRSDVYALGVMLYELLTGATPFDAKQLREAAYGEMQRIIREDEPPKPSTKLTSTADALALVAASRRMEPRALTAVVRGELDWIVMKALEKDRARRYEAASGLAHDVRRYVMGDPVHAAPPSSAYRLRKLVRRHRAPVMALSAIAVVLVGGVAATGIALRRALRAESDLRTQLAETHKAQQGEKSRSGELKQVSDFQTQMLSQIDTTKAGVDLMADIRERFSTALAKAKVPEDERAARLEVLRKELVLVNATDTAAAMIDETILKPAVRVIDERFKNQPVVDAQLRQALAELYYNIGMFDAAGPLQTKALHTRRLVLGDDHEDTIRSINNTGTWLSESGRLDEGERYFREGLDRSRRALGIEHPETLHSLNNMGWVLQIRGHSVEAEAFFREALARRERVLGPNDQETITSLNNMGGVLEAQGKLVEAKQFYLEALTRSRRALGDEHPDTLTFVHNLGGVLRALGKYDEAEKYHMDSMEMRRRVLGEAHPQTLSAIRSMGELLRDRGKLAEAESYFREALEKFRRVLGEEHPRTIAAISDVAGVLWSQGKLTEAELLCREALSKRRIVLGDDHPDTLKSISDTGLLLWTKGNIADAEPYWREALERRSRVLGGEHPDTISSISNMGLLLEKQGKLFQAEPYYREAFEKSRHAMGEDHPDTLAALNNMGLLLQAQGNLSEAESCFRQALERRRRVQGEEHPGTITSMHNLGRLLLSQGRLAEAEKPLSEALDTDLRVLGDNHPNTLISITTVGSLRLAQGKDQEAVDLLNPAEPAVRRAFADGNAPRLAEFLRALGRARVGLGLRGDAAQFALAEANLLEAHPIFVRARGESHADTQGCVQGLVDLYTAWENVEPDKDHDAKAAEWACKIPP